MQSVRHVTDALKKTPRSTQGADLQNFESGHIMTEAYSGSLKQQVFDIQPLKKLWDVVICKIMGYIYIYSRTSIIRISIIRTLGYLNTILNFKIL